MTIYIEREIALAIDTEIFIHEFDLLKNCKLRF